MLDLPVSAEELGREIASRLDPAALWDAKDVAAHLKCSPRYVTEGYALLPGFPTAIRLPAAAGGKKGHPRWYRSSIINWVADLSKGKSPAGGRPRKQMEIMQ